MRLRLLVRSKLSSAALACAWRIVLYHLRMRRSLGNLARAPAAASAAELGLPDRPCGYTTIGRHETFAAGDCVCHEGTRSPTFAGEYPRVRIGVMLTGTFHARTSRGDVLLGPGAMLLGNAGSAYEYRHVDDGGDRSIVFEYEEALLDHVAGDARKLFDRAAIPASAGSAAAASLALEALRSGEADALHEAALAALEVALAARGRAPDAPRRSRRQERQVASAMRYVEANPAEDCSLDALAGLVGVTSFHFLRVFRVLTGQTPRQFVIAARLRAAAAALRTTRDPITGVALRSGFGDLSHFNASFLRWFGASPGTYRRRSAAHGGDD
jgi:AraC family transcriptional regulator